MTTGGTRSVSTGAPEPGEPDPLAEATPAQRLILLGCGFVIAAVLVVVVVFAIAFAIRSI